MSTPTNDGGQKTLDEIVAELEKLLQCNCDLDNWEPNRDTGHSSVCRIHKTAKAKLAARNQTTT